MEYIRVQIRIFKDLSGEKVVEIHDQMYGKTLYKIDKDSFRIMTKSLGKRGNPGKVDWKETNLSLYDDVGLPDFYSNYEYRIHQMVVAAFRMHLI